MAVLLTSTGGLSGQYQKYFDKQLLRPVLQECVMDQFGQIRPLPPGMGATTVRFTRPPAPDRAQVDALTEGDPTTITDRGFTWTFIDATPTQVGKKARISDVLGETNLFDTLQAMSKLMGQDASHYYDFAITSEIIAGINSTSKLYAGGATDFASLVALTAADSTLKITDLLRAQTRLTNNRAPEASPNVRVPNAKGGSYVGVMAPAVAYDVSLDPKFIDAGIRGNNEGLFNGEMGSWYGVRIVKGTQPFREAVGGAEGTYSASGGVYSTIVTGSEQFGVVQLNAQGITSPKLIVLAKADKTDPANQYTSVAWKSYFVVKTLKDDWAVIVRSQTVYS